MLADVEVDEELDDVGEGGQVGVLDEPRKQRRLGVDPLDGFLGQGGQQTRAGPQQVPAKQRQDFWTFEQFE
jgi:hypothetical protein